MIQIHNIRVRTTWLVNADRPGMSNEIRILRRELEPAVVRITPKCARVTESEFLDRFVMVGGRSVKPVTHQLSVSIDGSVLLDVGSAIVRVKKVFRARLVFKPGDCRGRVDQRRVSVRFNNQIRSQAENPTPATVAVKAATNQSKVSEEFVVDTNRSSAANRAMGLPVDWIEKLEGAQQSGKFKVERPAVHPRVESNLGDDVGVYIGNTERGISGIHLRPVSTCERSRECYFARARRASAILFGGF